MTEPLLYEADRAAFLERAGRMQAHLAILTTKGPSFDVQEWARTMASIILEVEELPLVVGVRYRMKTLAGGLGTTHQHYATEAGEIVGIDVPIVTDPEYIELEGVYLGRRRDPFGSSAIFFDIVGRGTAMLSDPDLLRCEEIR